MRLRRNWRATNDAHGASRADCARGYPRCQTVIRERSATRRGAARGHHTAHRVTSDQYISVPHGATTRDLVRYMGVTGCMVNICHACHVRCGPRAPTRPAHPDNGGRNLHGTHGIEQKGTYVRTICILRTLTGRGKCSYTAVEETYIVSRFVPACRSRSALLVTRFASHTVVGAQNDLLDEVNTRSSMANPFSGAKKGPLL